MKYALLLSCLSLIYLIAQSCDLLPKTKVNNGVLIAKVGESKLYKSDLTGIVNKGVSEEDSLVAANAFVNNWVKQMAINNEAKKSIDLDELELERLLNNYEESIIKYHYEKKIIQSRIDTNVSVAELENYYNANKKNFNLRSNIVQAVYVKIPKDVSFIDSMRTWVLDFNEEYRYPLNLYATQYASSHSLNDSAWHTVDKFLRQLPTSVEDENRLINRDFKLEMADSINIYFLNIIGVAKKGESAPLQFVQKDIYDIIINKRKLDLINSIYESIYDEAVQNGKIKIYNNG